MCALGYTYTSRTHLNFPFYIQALLMSSLLFKMKEKNVSDSSELLNLGEAAGGRPEEGQV